MEHVALKATTVAADQGEFEAVISTATVDREKDVVSAAGMVRALQKWASHGKLIPLRWNHERAADQQIGHIDPASAKQVGGEVVVSGFVDQATSTGEHVWRLVKSGTLGFSFMYMILEGSKRKGGGRNIDELDVLEITATTTPVNNDTRVLAYKALAADDKPIDADTALRIAIDDALNQIPQSDLPPEVKDAALAKAARLLDPPPAVDEIDETPRSRQMDPLRAKADAISLEVLSGGESLRKPPRPKPTPPATPRLSVKELRRQMHQATLDALIGGSTQ